MFINNNTNIGINLHKKLILAWDVDFLLLLIGIILWFAAILVSDFFKYKKLLIPMRV